MMVMQVCNIVMVVVAIIATTITSALFFGIVFPYFYPPWDHTTTFQASFCKDS